MKRSDQEIGERHTKLQVEYRKSSDTYNPALLARIEELEWVMGSERYIPYDI
jgi:hypothetical protein